MDGPESTPMDGPERIQGERVVLRRVVAADLPWLHAAAAEPAVAAAWDDGAGTAWVDDLLTDDEVVAYIVEAGGRAVGFAQWGEEDDPAYRNASIDLFLVTDAQGAGYGRDVVRTLATWLVRERGHHASRSTRRPPTHARSAATRRSGSARSASRGAASAAPTAPGATRC
ncbi:MAG TPA: GNAT family N-acetyltransferase [Euzebyales bacterium]|nr:GNAT family N-acetyltransferase [Euzebyales bacterium]